MTPDPRRIKELFVAALDQPDAAARQAFLDRECAGDAELRQRLEVLLNAHDAPVSALNRPLAEIAPEFQGPRLTTDQPVSETPGTVIGPYKLLQQIGEGGMGTVWMAQQTEPVKRVVALKLIKAGMDSKQVIARFEAERQALALMDHANIARVLDAGATSAGRPYFVMDLVKGVPITKYCDEHHLTPRQRLELFIPVCQAVQHAHQKGIIHRDLKPSNVLVALYDGKPVPKVIDFGVAKAAGQSLTEKTLVTGFGAIVGTLEYMSPEQAEINQLDIDTRSDIYSLGVLLYELLAGSPPFSRKDLERAGMLEMLRVIREEEPSKPSTKLSTAEGLPTLAANRGTEPAKLTKLVRGELDWIVMKALEKDRNRRYETANGFAMDVQRYLHDEPVLAGPPSAMYRFRKFARRHRGGLAVVGLILFFLVLLVGGAGWMVRDQAARRAKLNIQLELILDEVKLRQAEHKWSEALAVARRAEALVAVSGGDADLHQRVGNLLVDLKLIQRLEELRVTREVRKEGGSDYDWADRSYAAAFSEYGVQPDRLSEQEVVELLHSRPHLAVGLPPALDDWALCRRKKGDAAGAKRLGAVVRRIDPDPWRGRVRQAFVQEDWQALDELAASPEVRRQPPATLYLLGLVLCNSGKVERGTDVLVKAQAEYPADFWINYQLGIGLRRLEPAHTEDAHAFIRAALALRPNSAATWASLGAALRDQKKLPEAIAACRKAIELDPKYAMAYNNLGVAFCDQKKPIEAMAYCRKAIELDPHLALAHNTLGIALAHQEKLTEAIAAFHKAIELDPKFANAYNNLGLALRKQKKLPEAIAAYHKAIELDPKLAAAYINLGVDFYAQKKLPEAIAAYHKAIELEPKSATAHYNLGLALGDQKKLPEAIAAYHKAIELDPKDAEAYYNLGNALREQKKLAEAIAAFHKAIEINPKYAKAYTNLGTALRDQQKVPEAIAAFHRAIEINPKFAEAYYNLAIALRAQQKLPEAIDAYHKAIELNPKYAEAYNNLGIALYVQKKLPEAIDAYHKAIELNPKHAQAYGNLGVALRAQQKLPEAIDAYHKAIEIDPKSAPAYNNLGAALRDQQKLPEAIAAFHKAIELDPTFAGAYFNLGLALRAQQKLPEAIAAYHKAIELNPKYAEAYYNLGNALRDQKNLPGAIDAFIKAAKLLPKHPAIQNNLRAAEQALAQELSKQKPLAENAFKGTLSRKEPEQVHESKMTAGKTYVVHMSSSEFDSYLRLEDAKKKILAENDDIDGTNLNSRLIFTPKEDGTYRIIATSFEQRGQGAYQLIVREFEEMKSEKKKAQ